MTNRMVAERMESIFTRRGIPVVPALGPFFLEQEEIHDADHHLQAIMTSGVSTDAN